MQTARASTKWAGLATFLPIAAALFGVGPAEASRTTTEVRPSLASSSPALTSLEPADPIAPPPGFGFAEDLSLLDVEARPCGFELFGGVGTSRCALTYAGNNPVTFIDPTGLMAECVGTQCTDSATVIAADPGAESARRFELELRMMRLRASSLRAKAADIVDRTAFQFVSGLGHVVVGAANDDPGEIAEGLFQHSLLVFGEAGYLIGAEVKIGRNFRLAPFGNRTGHPTGKFPHFHRRVVRPDGSTLPGGAIGRHRPWDAPPKGTPWWKFWRRF